MTSHSKPANAFQSLDGPSVMLKAVSQNALALSRTALKNVDRSDRRTESRQPAINNRANSGLSRAQRYEAFVLAAAKHNAARKARI